MRNRKLVTYNQLKISRINLVHRKKKINLLFGNNFLNKKIKNLKKTHRLRYFVFNKRYFLKQIFFIITCFLIVVIVFFIFSISQFYSNIQASFQSKFNFVHQDRCIKLDSEKVSIVLLEFNSDFKISKLLYFLKLKENFIFINFKEDLINKLNTFVGNNNSLLLTYFNYTGLEYFYVNIRTLLFEYFNIKVDFFLIFSDFNLIKQFLSLNKLNVFFKFINKENIENFHKNTPISIITNVCKNDINLLVQLLNSINMNSNLNVKNDFDIKKLLNILDIYKEQIRVHIENKSDSEILGILFKKLLENYGINVVKLDFSFDITDRTSLFLNSDVYTKAPNTLFLLNFLIRWDNLPYEEFTNNQNVFADIKLELGRDYINIFFNR